MSTLDPFSSATTQLAALRNGDISASELLELYLERIARYNRQINAIVIPNEEQARRQAAAADAEQGTVVVDGRTCVGRRQGRYGCRHIDVACSSCDGTSRVRRRDGQARRQ